MKERNLLCILVDEGYKNAIVRYEKDNTVEVFLDCTSSTYPLLPDYIIATGNVDNILRDKLPLNALEAYDITGRYKGIKYDKEHTPLDILREAMELLTNDRAKDYGDTKENFNNITTITNILLKHKGIVLEPDDIAAVMVALKIARQGNKHKRDNLVDAVAYLQIYNTLKE